MKPQSATNKGYGSEHVWTEPWGGRGMVSRGPAVGSDLSKARSGLVSLNPQGQYRATGQGCGQRQAGGHSRDGGTWRRASPQMGH